MLVGNKSKDNPVILSQTATEMAYFYTERYVYKTEFRHPYRLMKKAGDIVSGFFVIRVGLEPTRTASPILNTGVLGSLDLNKKGQRHCH